MGLVPSYNFGTNSISVITGYSELALKEIMEDNELRDYIINIHAAGEKAASLTKELLAFSRKQPLAMKVSSINLIIDNMKIILIRLIGENIKLEIENRNGIKNVLGDKSQLEQVLMNLIVNARDALPNGGSIIIKTYNAKFKKAIDIGNEHIEPGSYTVLSVKDSGTGMNENVQEKIFDPFFSTKAIGKGTGMGLSTVYGIIKQHSGYITVHSKTGEGTTFKIYLPITDKEVEVDVSTPVVVSKGNETILVVDDEPLLTELLVKTLEPLGYKLLSAHNGEEALQICNNFDGRIDLLLTDVVMPGMNGRDLAVEFLIERPEAKVIFMSGYTDDAIDHHGVLVEGVVLVNKPIKSSIISMKIREVLDTNLHKLNKNSTHDQLNGKNILLADDNKDICNLLQAYMKDYNCKIDTAENGKIALEKVKHESYDLILMDMQMPVMDGLTAIKEIRKWEKETGISKTAIIALTGNATKEDIDKCLHAGCYSHLAKPIKKDKLVDAILSGVSFIDQDECIKEEIQEEMIVAYVDTDLKQLIPGYLEERQNDIRKIEDAVKAQDYETVRMLGHTLKGSGGGYGFDPISEIGLELENAAQEENCEDIDKYINKLSDYIEHVEIVYE